MALGADRHSSHGGPVGERSDNNLFARINVGYELFGCDKPTQPGYDRSSAEGRSRLGLRLGLLCPPDAAGVDNVKAGFGSQGYGLYARWPTRSDGLARG